MIKKIISILFLIFTIGCLYFMSKGLVGIAAAYALILFNVARVLMEVYASKLIVDKLTISDKYKEEIPRKVGHILITLITLPMIYYSFKNTIHIVIVPILGLFIGYVLLKTKFLEKTMSRIEGDSNLYSVFRLILGFLINAIISLIYPSYTIGVLLGTIAVGVGDPVACLVGKRFGKIIFTNRKSLEGFIGFILSTTLAMYIVSGIAIWDLLIIAVVGALAEFYSNDYDNMLIQLAVALSAVFII